MGIRKYIRYLLFGFFLFVNGIIHSQTPIWSVASGRWDLPGTWNLGRIPQDGDSVIINTGDIVEIYLASNNSTIHSLNILGTLQWVESANINISTGGVTVDGGTINRNGNVAYITFVSDNASNYIKNDGSLFLISSIYLSGENSLLYVSGDSAINIVNYLYFSNSSLLDTVIFESSALVTITNDIVFDNDYSQVIVKPDCEVFIGDDIRMNSTDDNNNSIKIESLGSLTVNDDINFNSCVFNIYNYGTITQNGDFVSASSDRKSVV